MIKLIVLLDSTSFLMDLYNRGDEECETLVVFDNGASVPSRVHTMLLLFSSPSPCVCVWARARVFCFVSFFFFLGFGLYKYIKGDTGECGLSTWFMPPEAQLSLLILSLSHKPLFIYTGYNWSTNQTGSYFESLVLRLCLSLLSFFCFSSSSSLPFIY